jgi:hypothetical protein
LCHAFIAGIFFYIIKLCNNKKKKKMKSMNLFNVVALLVCTFFMTPFTMQAQFSGGNGSVSNPYIITTAAQLDILGGSYLSLHYKLGNDIDLAPYLAEGQPGYNDGAGWIPIGNSVNSFTGSFNGAGHKITGLWINRVTNSVGLFGYTANAVIDSLGVEIGVIGVKGNDVVGGLVGCSDNASTISNCYVTGNVSGASSNVGGLVGLNFHSSTIVNCYATGDVSGYYSIGGLVGNNNLSSISNCYATGNVNSIGKNVGGLAGFNATSSTIKNCVAANSSVIAIDAPDSRISRVVGYNDGGSLQNNYANAAMTVEGDNGAVTVTDDLNGPAGAGRTIAEFQSEEFYGNPNNWTDGVDFSTAWNICDGKTFPWLLWQNIDCDKLAPVITTTDLPDGAIGTEYAATLKATGTAPIIWSITDGNLPNGLTLDPVTGVISGIPATADIFTFTVKAENTGGSNNKHLSITITATAVAPVITTTTLPNGATGIEYAATLKATGTASIIWSITDGALPNGLSLNTATGVLSGKPATIGTFTFTVKATNSVGFDEKELSIKIDGVGIIETLRATSLRVFPNPTWGELTIVYPTSDNPISDIEIFDVMGRNVGANLYGRPNNTKIGKSEINVSHLPAGVYFLRIGNQTAKFVKQ